MPLRKSKGNMYGFITHTWNPIKGRCYHDCAYCYMKRFPQKPVRLDVKELGADLGQGNFIFVGSGTDMFTPEVRAEWIEQVLEKCRQYKNRYLFQSKNPSGLYYMHMDFPQDTVFCTTIETNRYYPQMGKAPPPEMRARAMNSIALRSYQTMVTIEPIMDFDLDVMLSMIQTIHPYQVNIGADSKGHNLPEPTAEKIDKLIEGLSGFVKEVYTKPNLSRLYGGKPCRK